MLTKRDIYVFTKTIKNIFSNFIPQETILCDDRDPPWISNKIKKLINEINTAYQSYNQNGKNEQSFQVLKSIIYCKMRILYIF